MPCIVDASHPRRHFRSPSLPLPPRPDVITIPLRQCCLECLSATEESLREGEEWQEKFTRGARRRRSSSASTHAHNHALRHRSVRDELPGFGAIVSVDEVDKRHGISRTASTPEPPLSEEEESEEGLLPSLTRRLQSSEPSPASPIREEADDGFPLPRRPSTDYPSASSPPLLPPVTGNTSPLFSQTRGDETRLAPILPDDLDHADEGVGAVRETIYYTPESSPTLPPLEPSCAFTASPTEKYTVPTTPPMAMALPPSSAPVQIPGSAPNSKSYFSNLSLSSFELVHTPPSSSPLQIASAHYDGHSVSTASPELIEYVPALSSGSPARKRLLHFPNLPGPGSFLRVGAEMFRGVSVLATPGVSPVA